MPFKIAILGTGNVGYHLARRLKEVDHMPAMIIGRDAEKVRLMVNDLALSSEHSSQTSFIEIPFDFVLLAVPDRAIEQVVRQYQFHKKSIIVHTSGAQPLNLLTEVDHCGVLYPFQTFTKNKPVDFEQIPLLVEGNSKFSLAKILELATLFGHDIHQVNSEKRLKIHLAAVFASNFTNYLYSIADDILKDTGLQLSDLNHLMQETAEKAIELNPRMAQTGPAIRHDEAVIQKHLNLLESHPDFKSIYTIISEQIGLLNKK
ncbi:MAG: DUF2520 domain-containing protein [Marinoscillum sp.]|uniref:Rossmann-like and DUF2520 domain-containing protein n=1 Tax=Marinoscillum sp. TaxID=2024838 RepID=UPI0032FFAFC6